MIQYCSFRCIWEDDPRLSFREVAQPPISTKSIAQIYPKNMVLNNNLSWRGLSLGWFMGNSTGTYGFPHIFCLLTAILRVFSLRRVCKFWVMVFTIFYNAI